MKNQEIFDYLKSVSQQEGLKYIASWSYEQMRDYKTFLVSLLAQMAKR